jgi:hypothetical protein
VEALKKRSRKAKPRIPTKIKKGAIEQRLTGKKRAAEKKRLRAPIKD